MGAGRLKSFSCVSSYEPSDRLKVTKRQRDERDGGKLISVIPLLWKLNLFAIVWRSITNDITLTNVQLRHYEIDAKETWDCNREFCFTFQSKRVWLGLSASTNSSIYTECECCTCKLSVCDSRVTWFKTWLVIWGASRVGLVFRTAVCLRNALKLLKSKIYVSWMRMSPVCKGWGRGRGEGINIDKSSGLSRPSGASVLGTCRGVKRENKVWSICYALQRNATDKHNNPTDSACNVIFANSFSNNKHYVCQKLNLYFKCTTQLRCLK